MKLDIISYRDDSDGGATVELDLDKEATQFLINKGFNSFLKDTIDQSTPTVLLENEKKCK